MNLEWRKTTEEQQRLGYRRIIRKTFELPDERHDTFDILDEGESVSIFALTADDEVIIAKQFRPGPEEVVWDLPCGAIEKGEMPFQAAARELLEETGYAGDLREIAVSLESAYSNKRRHNFVAAGCRKVAAPTPDPGEFIETELLPLPEFRALLRSGKLTVIETGYLGLDHLGLL